MEKIIKDWKLKLVSLLLKIVDYLTKEHKRKNFLDSNTLLINGEGYSTNQTLSFKPSTSNGVGFYVTITGQRKHYTVDFDLTDKETERLIKYFQQQLHQMRRMNYYYEKQK